MVRRLISIPLALILAIAVFTSSVFAAPDNDYDTQIDVSYQFVSGLFGQERFINSGTLASYGYWSSTSENYVALANYSGTVPFTYDLYVAVLTSSLPYVTFEGLDAYYYPAGNLTENINVTSWLFNYYDGYFGGNTPLEVSTVENVTFCYFKGVPAGTTFMVNDINPYPPDGVSYINTYSSVAQANVNFTQFLFGFYFGYAKVSGDDIINQYENGEISLSDAISSINDIVKDNISDSSDFSQSTLNVLIGQSQIDELLRLSDNNFLSKMVNKFVLALNSFISEYQEGYLTLEDTLSEFNRSFRSYLDDAETLEQGEILFSTYELALKQLEVTVDAVTSSRIGSVLDDEDLSSMITLKEFDIFLNTQFDVELFQAQTNFDIWLNQLPLDESVNFKRFLDYFLNDSPLRFFILVPMSLGLFRLFLGTSLSLISGKSFSR